MRVLLLLVCSAALIVGMPGAAMAGSPTSTTIPAQPALRVVADWMGACAIVRGGHVECLGYNPGGQQGDGARVTTNTPVPVRGIAGATSLASGGQSNCAVVGGGQVMCWGQNDLSVGAPGQLGDGSRAHESLVPVFVHGLSGVRSVVGMQLAYGATGGYCALTETGTVWCWGIDDGARMAGGLHGNGLLGDGTSRAASSVPVEVVGLQGPVRSVSAGQAGWCVVLVAGGADCWGDNQYNELGDGQFGSLSGTGGSDIQQYSNVAVPVLHLTGVESITSARGSNCALTRTHQVWCWGNNSAGALGNGQKANPAHNFGSDVPVQVRGLGGVKSLAADTGTYCALLDSGSVRCWGSNGEANLGNGNVALAYSDVPVPVKGLSGVKSLWGSGNDGGNSQIFCAVLIDGGRVKCWGGNGFGMVGSGSQANVVPTPELALGLAGVKSIAVGTSGEIAYALLWNGAVWWWGNQDPTYATPQQVPGFGPS